MPTISSSVSSMRTMPGASWTRCVIGSNSVRGRGIRKSPGSSSSGALRRNAASGADSANRRPSTSWVSPSSAARPERENSRSNGRPKGPACGLTSRKKKKEWRGRRPQPIPAQGQWLGRVVCGYFNYHAVPTNGRALEVFRHHVTDSWRRTLRRRSQKDRITWARMTQLMDGWLPKPIILHPWPSDRFAVTHPRWEKLWGGRRRLWHLHRPYEPMEVAPWYKSTISAEAYRRLIRSRPWWWSSR